MSLNESIRLDILKFVREVGSIGIPENTLRSIAMSAYPQLNLRTASEHICYLAEKNFIRASKSGISEMENFRITPEGIDELERRDRLNEGGVSRQTIKLSDSALDPPSCSCNAIAKRRHEPT